jgi:hypothetical protein
MSSRSAAGGEAISFYQRKQKRRLLRQYIPRNDDMICHRDPPQAEKRSRFINVSRRGDCFVNTFLAMTPLNIFIPMGIT